MSSKMDEFRRRAELNELREKMRAALCSDLNRHCNLCLLPTIPPPYKERTCTVCKQARIEDRALLKKLQRS